MFRLFVSRQRDAEERTRRHHLMRPRRAGDHMKTPGLILKLKHFQAVKASQIICSCLETGTFDINWTKVFLALQLLWDKPGHIPDGWSQRANGCFSETRTVWTRVVRTFFNSKHLVHYSGRVPSLPAHPPPPPPPFVYGLYSCQNS